MVTEYKYDVFLSFSSKDMPFVKPIWEKLKKSRLKVFFADENLKKNIGLEFVDEIENALQQSQHFLLVCTKNSMASDWVRDEYKAFYHQIYKKSGKKRRFFILEGPGFDISLMPLLMRQLQIAKSVDEIIEVLGDKPVKWEEEQEESQIQKKSDKKTFKKFASIIWENKFIKGASIGLALAAMIIFFVFVINPQKTSLPSDKITQKDKGNAGYPVSGTSKKPFETVTKKSSVPTWQSKKDNPPLTFAEKTGKKEISVAPSKEHEAKIQSEKGKTTDIKNKEDKSGDRDKKSSVNPVELTKEHEGGGQNQTEKTTDIKDKEDKSGDRDKRLSVNRVEPSKEHEAGGQNQTEKTTAELEEILTAHEVYQMISEKGFYCEIVAGSSFHDEGLNDIAIPGDGIFKDRRLIISVIEKEKELITTESELKSGNDNKIVLWWPLSEDIPLKEISFQSAQAKIDILNKKNEDKNKKWRMPTILELFSIIKQASKNHFPEIFKFPYKKENIIIWTSTVVKKEGTHLDYDKISKAYFVVRSLYYPKNDFYSVTFAPFNIEGREPKQAYLLPVYSDIEYRYKSIFDQLKESNILGMGDDKGSTSTSTGNTTNSNPSADTQNNPPDSTGPKNQSTAAIKSSNKRYPERILGFDDVPDSNKVQSIPEKKKQNYLPRLEPGLRKIKIGLIPFTYAGGGDSNQEKRYLNHINDQIEESLKDLEAKLNGNNIQLILKKIDANDINNVLTTNYNYVSQLIRENDELKRKAMIEKLEREIMKPTDIDIIITVKHYNLEGIEMRTPIIINRIDRTVHEFRFAGNTSNASDNLVKVLKCVKETMGEIIKKWEGKEGIQKFLP